MSTDLIRHALNGPTMGTRWSALFYAPTGVDPVQVQRALQAAVQQVDSEMSTWNPHSDLMRLNAAPTDVWLAAPTHLMKVLTLGLEVGKASGGAFDIGLGDAVAAWGFGATAATSDSISAAMQVQRRPAHDVLELDLLTGRVRKTAPIALDLNGIAKGYGTDRLAETLLECGIAAGLVGIDGEMRALGLRPDGDAWSIAIEAPDHHRRAAHAVVALEEAAVATSGDYRQWVTVQGRQLSHTMNPRKGAPLAQTPASVTIIAPTCAAADAWATAMMVLGPDKGGILALQRGLDVLFIMRDTQARLTEIGIGNLFGAKHEGADLH